MKKLAITLAILGTSVTTFATPVPVGAAPAAPNVKPWLLGLSNMPAGWEAEPSFLSPSLSSSGSACANLLQATLLQTTQSLHPGSYGEVHFTEGVTPQVAEIVASWPTQPSARSAWRVVNTVFARCHQFSATLEGQTVNFAVGPVNLGHDGDVSRSYQVAGTVIGINIDADVMVAAKGRALMLVVYGGLGSTNRPQAVSIVKTAIAKIGG
jgi:hypothetical protein